MQRLLDEHRGAANTLLAVKNEACGTSVYLTGDRCHARTDSLWRIGSITKTYVAAATMSLVEEGTLSLADPVERWVPGLAGGAEITLHMLLSHRSGLFNYTDDRAFQRDPTHVWAPREIVNVGLQHPPYFAAGTDFHYSNTNYILLGLVLEAATALPLATVLRSRALAPAGLQQTFFDGADAYDTPLTHGLIRNQMSIYAVDPSRPWAAGAMLATGADVAEWVWALYGTDRVLGATARTQMIDVPSRAGGYGLGTVVLRNPEARSGDGLGHTGGIGSFSSAAFYFPAHQTSIAVLVNRTDDKPDAVLRATAQLLFAD